MLIARPSRNVHSWAKRIAFDERNVVPRHCQASIAA